MLAIAVDDVVVDGVVYTWDSDLSGYVASGWDGTTPITHLRILNEVNEMNVVAVGDNAFNFSQDAAIYDEIPPIESLVIEDGITSIGLNAFIDCSYLRSAVIPGSVTVIGDAAFFRCSALKVLKLSEGLQTIEDEAFANCSAMETVVIPASVRTIDSRQIRQVRDVCIFEINGLEVFL